ncbi:FAD-dependent monooxygenase [Rhodoferax sp.]|uniref:FAD-dependent monooxygenase n=1 Tax=Rhodoferax sp. TaxID=50421 RepID=UPI002632298B|nr:FAD-dependent monooxygenase [Rhodoferax sp.]MDD2924339.1 FAD-dependent monooxygenase [Rhodoferax sp.]
MHLPHRQPHPSSYFKYEIYPFVRPSDMGAPEPTHHPVVVVGAGPAGLVLAIQLASNGVACVLIESEAQVSGGSRALALTKRSMEIIEQSGVAQQFLQRALVWKDGYSFYKNRVVHHLDLPFSEDDKFAPMTNLPQCVMEKILVDRARELGVDMRFQTRLEAMEATADGVTLTLDTPEGDYRIHADWVVGCDGARSAVRRLQGLRFEGKSYESRFVIADFNIALEEPTGRRCYYEPPWLPGHTALMHKAPGGIWRLDYQVPDDVTDEQALDPKRIHGHIQAHLDYIGVDLPWTIEWTTLYKPNTLTLASYHHGRVLYCGDAAHLLPVFGVRGMNTGIQDSINLAWKLAAVVHHQAQASILDSYSSERVADARQICIEAGRSTRMMAPPTRGYRVLQQAVLSLSLNHAFTRGLLHWRTSHPIDYASSPLTWVDATESNFAAGPTPGAPARNVQLEPGKPDSAYLLDAFQPAFQVLVFGQNAALWQAAREDVLAARQQGLRVRLMAITVDGTPMADADAVLHDPLGHAQALWGTADGAVYVLRPDQHVCARWSASSGTRVKQVLDHVLSAAQATPAV